MEGPGALPGPSVVFLWLSLDIIDLAATHNDYTLSTTGASRRLIARHGPESVSDLLGTGDIRNPEL
jgi:hypothetical protein